MFPIAVAVTLAFSTIDPVELDIARKLHQELSRFPCDEVADRWISFGEAQVDWAKSRNDKGLMKDAYLFTSKWCGLRRAQNQKESLEDRLQALMELEEWIGTQNWLLGRMPLPHIAEFLDGPPPDFILEDFEKNVTALRPFIPKLEAFLKAAWFLQTGKAASQITSVVVPKMARCVPFTKERIVARLFLRK